MVKPILHFDFKNGSGFVSSSDFRQLELLYATFYENKTIYKRGKRKHVKIHQVSPSGKFNIGFFYTIRERLKDTHVIKASKEFKDALKPVTNLNVDDVSAFEGIAYTYYQVEAIQEMMIRGRGVIELGTSGGKSYICAGFAQSVVKQQPEARVLVIVPGLSLVNQLYNDCIRKFKMDNVTILTSTLLDEYDPSKRIIITNSECLVAQLKKNENSDVLNCDYVIVDECHKINANTWISTILQRTTTQKRFGMTATLPDIGVDYYNIVGKIGRVIYSKDAKTLRDEDFVAQLKIKMLILTHSVPPKYPSRGTGLDMYNAEKNWLMDNATRNRFICSITKKFTNTSLILVDRIDYGVNLTDMLLKMGKKSIFIRGSTKVEDREMIQKQMEVSDDMVVVAMDRIFSTGISINNIHHIIFACIGKAKIKILQSIGRGLRKNHNKEHVVVYDVADDLKCSIGQLNERFAIYSKEVDVVDVRRFVI